MIYELSERGIDGELIDSKGFTPVSHGLWRRAC